MQIECPSCGTAYDVPDQILARKRVMRCARCARDWTPVQTQAPEPVQEVLEPTPVAAPVATPPEPVAPIRASASRKVAIVSAWAASFAVLALAGWWSITAEKRIVQAWPPSARLYAALGM